MTKHCPNIRISTLNIISWQRESRPYCLNVLIRFLTVRQILKRLLALRSLQWQTSSRLTKTWLKVIWVNISLSSLVVLISRSSIAQHTTMRLCAIWWITLPKSFKHRIENSGPHFMSKFWALLSLRIFLAFVMSIETYAILFRQTLLSSTQFWRNLIKNWRIIQFQWAKNTLRAGWR